MRNWGMRAKMRIYLILIFHCFSVLLCFWGRVCFVAWDWTHYGAEGSLPGPRDPPSWASPVLRLCVPSSPHSPKDSVQPSSHGRSWGLGLVILHQIMCLSPCPCKCGGDTYRAGPVNKQACLLLHPLFHFVPLREETSFESRISYLQQADQSQATHKEQREPETSFCRLYWGEVGLNPGC